MLGTNDIGFGMPAQDTLNFVKQLHAICHARNVVTMAMGPPTVSSGWPRSACDQLKSILHNWQVRHSRQAVAFVDSEKLVPKTTGLWDPDDLHFSPAGSIQLG